VAARIERFEELIAWQKARILTREIYETTRRGAFARDFGLSGQIQRAAVRSCPILRKDLNAEGEESFTSFSQPLRLRVPSFDPNYMSLST
jgi:23S rRNA-intervening sequence protein